ncbi:hypothetical protein RHOSPDRAFT_27811 [Rhodotorula sp. JG-1b]|nr:hypothetical protein RHOSPDRAFT_27811 [Rhodotorula sp. JG-1b]
MLYVPADPQYRGRPVHGLFELATGRSERNGTSAPYAIAATDATATVLAQLATAVGGPGLAAPSLATFDAWLRQNVPDFAHVDGPSYNALGANREPPIFDQDAFQSILNKAQQLSATGGGELLLIVDVLECLVNDWPRNFHALSPNHPPARGTALVVQAMRSIFSLLQVNTMYWMHDVFTVCRAPALAEWKRRHQQSPNLVPPAARIKGAKLLGELFFKCLPSNNIKVSAGLLSGTVTNQFAGQAGGGGVKLEKWHVHSQLIGINCYTNYHYSIMVNSIFPHLRSALLDRLCLVIHNMASKLPSSAPAVALLPVSDIYKCLLVLLPGYRFASFEAVSKTFAYNPRLYVQMALGAQAAVAEKCESGTNGEFLKHLPSLPSQHMRTLLWDQGFEAEVLELDDVELAKWCLAEAEQVALGAGVARQANSSTL